MPESRIDRAVIWIKANGGQIKPASYYGHWVWKGTDGKDHVLDETQVINLAEVYYDFAPVPGAQDLSSGVTTGVDEGGEGEGKGEGAIPANVQAFIDEMKTYGYTVTPNGDGTYTLEDDEGIEEPIDDLTKADFPKTLAYAKEDAAARGAGDGPDMGRPANLPAGVKWPPTKKVQIGKDQYGDPVYEEVPDTDAMIALDKQYGKKPTPLATPEYTTDAQGKQWVRTTADGEWEPVEEAEEDELTEPEYTPDGKWVRTSRGGAWQKVETTDADWDDEYEKLLIQAAYGDENAKKLAISLWDTRNMVEKGRMTEVEADAFIGTLPISVPEMRAWRDALMGDRAVVTGEPAMNPNPFTSPPTTTNQFGQVTGSNVFPGSEAFAGWGTTAPGTRDIRPGESWEEWIARTRTPDPFMDTKGMTPEQTAIARAIDLAGGLEAYLKLSPMEKEILRWEADAREKGVSEEIIQDRLARAKTARAAANVPSPFATGANAPPPGWGTARFVPNDQWNAMTPEERNAYFAEGGPGYVAPPATPFVPAAVPTPVAQNQFGKPQTPTLASWPVTQAAGSTPQARMAMWNRGEMAQYEQGLFGIPQTQLTAGDAFEQIQARAFGRKRQKKFEATPVPRASYR